MRSSGKNITIRQIADMAGVSVAAVSIVLNNKKGVSDETRQRILNIIREVKYTPNVNSRRLILQRSFNILLAIDAEASSLSNYFYMAIASSIVKRGYELGYNIVLIADTDTFEDSRLSVTLSQHNADGIIFLRDLPAELQNSIRKTDTPFVVVDSQQQQPPYPCVRADYELSALCATEYLIRCGHSKIAFISNERIPELFRNSFRGYKAALAKTGLPLFPDWIQSGAYDEQTAKECMARILQAPELPTAVYCIGDIFAIGAMSYLQDAGYRLPEDFSICSADDIALSRYYHPALTTVRIDKDAMGTLAVDMLDKLINGAETETICTVRSDDLVIRDSVATIA